MKVLIVSAEAVPFAKVGGLADVVGSLPAALRANGVDARVIMPGYGFIEHLKYNVSLLFSFKFTHQEGVSDIQVFTCVRDGVPYYMIQGWPYFGQDATAYTTWDWDVPRFIFFNQVTMALIWELQQRLGWMPDVVNVNDWHTGLLPFLISQQHHQPEWQSVATVCTIHNIAYQGDNIGGYAWKAGIPGRYHPMLEAMSLNDNMLAMAIAYSDMINTVSPRYAMEIQHAYAGFNLAPLIKSRADDLVGILNGIDTNLMDPETDRYLVANYNADDFVEKRLINKHHMQAYSRLPIRDDVPMIGIVSRLTWQKGFDMAIPALRSLLVDTDAQFIALGTGDPGLESALRQLGRDFNWRARIFTEFDAALAQQIYAGCDLFLMPSHFEPCGIGQMIAMRYGALPLVRETGGLADTVINYDGGPAENGTGFVFQWEEVQAVLGTLRWALDTYHDHPLAWQRMQKRAMTTDFGWQKSAREYTQLYQQAISKRKGVKP